MFEDLDTAESKTEDSQDPSEDKQTPHWWIGPWAHVIAGLVFCLLYFPFDQHKWSWQAAVTVAYIVFMLCCTCGLAFKDSDDLFGNLRVPEYMGKLLIRQILVLAIVSLTAYLWRYSKSILPGWVTQEGRRMSLWDYLGIILVYVIAVKEAKWMAARIKRQFPELEDSV
jgi:di/tricarboxylate transporter